MSIIEAVILAIIEGITEFLPISSTGHMIIASSLMGIEGEAFTKVFEVNIQFGAILSVVVLYWKRFFQSFTFYFKLFVAFLPAAFFGLLLNDYIDALLGSPLIVAISLLIGGIVLVYVDSWFPGAEEDIERPLPYLTALKIGLFQCLAMVPGVSRSAATIIGGMTEKLSRKQAAEFSFFLAVPTMFAAAGYKLLKDYQKIQADDIQILLLGNIIAFFVALLAIKFFINFLTRYGFRVFGYYRIVVGLLILGLMLAGVELKLD